MFIPLGSHTQEILDILKGNNEGDSGQVTLQITGKGLPFQFRDQEM